MDRTSKPAFNAADEAAQLATIDCLVNVPLEFRQRIKGPYDRFVEKDEIALILNCHRSTLDRRYRNPLLTPDFPQPDRKKGCRYRIWLPHLLEWIAKRRGK